MNSPAPGSTAGAAPGASAMLRVMLQVSFSDPDSALRLPLSPPPALRVALGARLRARGGLVVDASHSLSSFHATAAEALEAAVEILARGTAAVVVETAVLALRVVVLSVTGDSDAVRGLAIARAAAVLTMSRDQTLLLSCELHSELDHSMAERARLAAPAASVDAYPELADLFDLDWQTAALHLAEVAPLPERQPAKVARATLELSHGGSALKLHAENCPLTIGRDKRCALYLGGDAASRLHGQIEHDHGQFYFVDESRNGTYVLTPQGEEVFLHRERLALVGRGLISPGAPIVQQTGEVLRYRCGSEDDLETLIASLVPPPVQAEAAMGDYRDSTRLGSVEPSIFGGHPGRH